MVAGGKENIVVVRPFEEGLILHTMYYADEVRDFAAIDLERAQVKEKEVKLAEMLINELTEKKFDPLQYKDEYRERLMDRIRAKAQGKTIVAEEREEEKPGEVIDIMDALRRSLEGGRAAAPRGQRRASAKRAPAAARKTRAVASRKRKAS